MTSFAVSKVMTYVAVIFVYMALDVNSLVVSKHCQVITTGIDFCILFLTMNYCGF